MHPAINAFANDNGACAAIAFGAAFLRSGETFVTAQIVDECRRERQVSTVSRLPFSTNVSRSVIRTAFVFAGTTGFLRATSGPFQQSGQPCAMLETAMAEISLSANGILRTLHLPDQLSNQF
jgi:hypothetical protein